MRVGCPSREFSPPDLRIFFSSQDSHMTLRLTPLTCLTAFLVGSLVGLLLRVVVTLASST